MQGLGAKNWPQRHVVQCTLWLMNPDSFLSRQKKNKKVKAKEDHKCTMNLKL